MDSDQARLSPIHDAAARRAFAMHDRIWQANRYVYPVVSRRSKGISVGINLNPDKVCNFDCIYCSVDRSKQANAAGAPAENAADIDLQRLRFELAAMLELAQSGELYRHDPFDKIPSGLRRLNDIAFSGDGEPTTCPQFPEACELAIELRSATLPRQEGIGGCKIVTITNATMFHRPRVREALRRLDKNRGEVWGKLDAGTDAYYHLVDRTTIPFQRVLDNLLWAARNLGQGGAAAAGGETQGGIVIQSLFMKVHGAAPAEEEIAAYAGRLEHLLNHGGRLKLIQIYTVARTTTEAYATALSQGELEAIAASPGIAGLRPAVAVEVYP